MRGGKRLGVAIWTAGLALTSVPLFAQSAPDTTANAPASDAVGPRELQNFSLSGTVTRPADQPPAQTTRTAPAAANIVSTETRPVPAREASREAKVETPNVARAAPTAAAPAPKPAEVMAAAPPAMAASVPAPAPAVAESPASFPTDTASSTATLAPQRGFGILPWLLAAAVLGAGAAFLFFRNRSRHALAAGPQLDLFAPPEPQPAPMPPRAAPLPPQPAPQPRPAAPAPKPSNPAGIVSSGLRGWLELAMHPTRCVVEDHQVTIEFDLELFNSGSAAVRGILVEAVMLNAGPAQEQEINAFFGKPAGGGDRIDMLGPLKRMTLNTRVVTSREHVRTFKVGEREVFVPLLAFNAHYRAGSTDGQTAVSYLVGRDGNGQKMAPFRLDLGPRLFRGLGARLLPVSVRT